MAKKTRKSNKSGGLQPLSTEPQITVAPKIEDPIGGETGGEAQAALQPALEPKTEAEIEAPEDNAKIEAEVEAGPQPKDGPQPESADFEPGAPASAAADSSLGWEPGAPTDGSSSVGWNPPAKLVRLQKILAQAGVASRRKAEQLIEQGRVQVNGKVVAVLGAKADAARDHIRVDGKLLQGAERLRYFVLNKPRGFVTTVKDPEGRPTVMQFFDKMRERLYPVGRLDYMSEGLLLVTNDGELAHRLTRAAAGVEKTYLVKVAGQPTEAELDILRGGISIPLGQAGSRQVHTSPARIRQVRQGDNPWYEVVLIEGRNRELRKMFEQIGHFVEKIRRVGYGPLVLDQEPGNLRELYPEELEQLRKVADGTLRAPQSKEIRRRNAVDAQLPTLLPRPTARPRPAKPFESGHKAHSKDYRPKKSFDSSRPNRPVGGEFRSSRPSGKNFGPVRPAQHPAWKQKDDRPPRPPARFATGSTGADRPSSGRSYPDRPSPARPSRPSADRPRFDRPGPGRSSAARSSSARPFRGEGDPSRPFTASSGKPRAGGARPGRPFESKSAGPPARPFRGEGERSFAPRGEKRTGWKPKPSYGGPAKPPSSPRSKPKPGVPTDRSSSVGWKPGSSGKSGYKGKPSNFDPKHPGGFSKSGYKGKPSAPRRPGAPGGKKRR